MAADPLAWLIRPLVWCRAEETVREVATRIGSAAGSYALVRTESGLGIVTDNDFRRLVATGIIGVDSGIGALASVPALTIDRSATVADALLRMVEHAVHHLVVTDGDTPTGVVRAMDLAAFEIRVPLLLRAAIDAAPDRDALTALWRSIPDALAELRDNDVPARQVSAVHSALIEAVLGRMTALRGDPVLAAVDHSWLFLGSLARREPLPSSDLDTALVWVDPPTGVSADEIRTAAGLVLDDLSHCGLRPCPKGVRADNPLFSRSRADWATAVWSWQRDPTKAGALLLSAMIADSRPVTGLDLGLNLTADLRSHARTSQYLRLLLDEAIHWRTSTGTLRAFRVDHSGGHRGEVDLKRGGLVPVVALGRWIAIVTGEARGTTVERLARGVRAGLLTEDERHTLSAGFDGLFTVLYDREVAALRAGAEASTYVRPQELDSLTRRHLRETLRAIGTVQRRVDEFWLRRLEKE